MNTIHIVFHITIREERWSGAQGNNELTMQMPLSAVETFDPGAIFKLMLKSAIQAYHKSLAELAEESSEEL